MKAVNFEYDGRYLSDVGFEIVQFDESGGFQYTTAGSELSLSTISTHGGKRHYLVNAVYDEVFVGNISICKPDGSTVSSSEYSFIMRWLNKKTFAPLKILTSDLGDVNFVGTFASIDKVEHLGRIIGFNLTFTTNAPFGWGDQETDSFNISSSSPHVITNISEESGELPFDELIITCNAAGTLKLTNEANGLTTIITGCTSGEVITINGQLLTVTSSTGRNVYDSFNFVYPQLTNTTSLDSVIGVDTTTYIVTRSNEEVVTRSGENILVYGPVNGFTSTLSCDIIAKYTPIRKVVF